MDAVTLDPSASDKHSTTRRIVGRPCRFTCDLVYWFRAHPAVPVVVGMAVFLIGFALVYEWLPWWMDGVRLRHLAWKDQVGALATDRDEVLKIVAGIGGVIALVYTIRRHNIDRRTLEATQRSVEATQKRDAESVRLTIEAQVTDRYTKAIGQLASDKPEERLGGIYALERIMADSPRDQPTIIEVLAAYVRRTSPHPAPRTANTATQHASTTDPGVEPHAVTRPSEVVAAAVTVLARRPKEQRPHIIDLRRTNLAGIELPAGSHLEHADLRGACLNSAILHNIDLSGANLADADLTEARFSSVILKRASFIGARLVRTGLHRTDLTGADFSRADLSGANLYRLGASRARFDEATLVETRLVRVGLELASMRDADLTNAKLTDSGLRHTVLSNADLTGVKLVSASIEFIPHYDGPVPGTHLDGTDLTHAEVTAAQLAGAYLTDSTRLPLNLVEDPWVRKRIEECSHWASSFADKGRSIPLDLEGLAVTQAPDTNVQLG